MRFLIYLIFYSVHFYLPAQEHFEMKQLAPDNSLSDPWEILYGTDNMLWITSRSAKTVIRIDPETGNRDFLLAINDAFQTSTQDGLLGMALHPELGQGAGRDFVYLSYTYFQESRKQKIVRYTFTLKGSQDGSLIDPVAVITDLPASNDHNSGRLLFGPDDKLYYTIGNQGKNQYENVCEEILAQALPTQSEVDVLDWSTYQGKVLRLNTDGSIPADNPIINGVQSHIFSYGHRNPQGLVFAADGSLFSSEHGPKTDDEINRIEAGKNYGWPYVAGYQDDNAYVYCNWSSTDNCGRYDDYGCPAGAEVTKESAWTRADFVPPIKTFYTVGDDYNFVDPSCNVLFICWPTIAPSSIDIYENSTGIPGWSRSLLVVSLKLGMVFRQPIDDQGNALGEALPYWDTQNRYRDIAVHPNGREFFMITDNRGQTSGPSNSNTDDLDNPGAILRFKYRNGVLGHENSRNDPLIKIYPNPMQEKATLTFSHTIGKVNKQIRIISLQGNTIFQHADVLSTLELPDLSAGVYLVQVEVEGIVLTERLIVR
ncbi:MAG: PQQ-dependent sugar dehydrogenase [Marinoscillum sp.]